MALLDDLRSKIDSTISVWVSALEDAYEADPTNNPPVKGVTAPGVVTENQLLETSPTGLAIAYYQSGKTTELTLDFQALPTTYDVVVEVHSTSLDYAQTIADMLASALHGFHGELKTGGFYCAACIVDDVDESYTPQGDFGDNYTNVYSLKLTIIGG